MNKAASCKNYLGTAGVNFVYRDPCAVVVSNSQLWLYHSHSQWTGAKDSPLIPMVWDPGRGSHNVAHYAGEGWFPRLGFLFPLKNQRLSGTSPCGAGLFWKGAIQWAQGSSFSYSSSAICLCCQGEPHPMALAVVTCSSCEGELSQTQPMLPSSWHHSLSLFIYTKAIYGLEVWCLWFLKNIHNPHPSSSRSSDCHVTG